MKKSLRPLPRWEPSREALAPIECASCREMTPSTDGRWVKFERRDHSLDLVERDAKWLCDECRKANRRSKLRQGALWLGVPLFILWLAAYCR